jgi:hypothetical protein
MEWIVGIVSGLISGTMTCWLFYWLSGKDLKRETEDLRSLNILTIKALVAAGLADVELDINGKPTGLRYKFEGSGTLTVRGSALAGQGAFEPQRGNVEGRASFVW